MKKIILFLSVLYPLLSLAQMSGEVTYEDKMNLHRRLTGERERFKEFVPEFRSTHKTLLFSEGESLYTTAKEQPEQDVPEAGPGGRRFRMRMGANNEILYKNLAEGTQVAQRDFMDKKFLITGDPEKFQWKLTGKQMKFGEYLCMEATFEDSARKVVVWFTPQIPVSTGPADFGGLPGLVLAVDINEGERQITALDIQLRPLEEGEITKPTKGKEMTDEEYRQMVREKMQEMRRQGGGRTMMIRRP
ncbi:MAG: GLPGLI family protein [Bacteroidetes bacterium]|nr:MAG: GLPGLI family protein [Bacteroidota bacterium]